MKTGLTHLTLIATVLLYAAASAAGPSYSLLTTVGLTPTAANSQGGAFTSFDIGFVDPVTGYYYVADRSNNTVDVINGASHTLIGQVGVGLFGGQAATTSVSGPDGVVVVNTGGVATLYAGGANSTLFSFNVTNPAAAIQQGSVNTGGGPFRVDEMAYDPTGHLLFVANNANSPAFGSLVSATPPSPSLVHGNISIPGQVASGGMEQSVWDPNTGTFFVSVPTFNGTDAGGLAQISTAGLVLNTYNLTGFGIASCSPTGLALGASGDLAIGCGNTHTQSIVFNPAGAGSVVTLLGAVSGSDEIWYDPASGRYYFTGFNSAGDRVIDIFHDGDFALLQSIDLTTLGAGLGNMHSVAVDPLNGDIFVPLLASTTSVTDRLCPGGCIAVFAEANVPEPSPLSLLALALLGFAVTTTRDWKGHTRKPAARRGVGLPKE